MITLLVIGTLVFVCKVVALVLKATWGLTKGILFALGLPILLVVLVTAGLAFAGVPILVLALLALFFIPIMKGA